MIISLKETHRPTPTEWFELYLNNTATQIYFPSKAIFNHMYVKDDIHVCVRGIDLEVEEVRRLYDELITMFPDTFEMKITRLEILMAFHDAIPRLREKIGELGK